MACVVADSAFSSAAGQYPILAHELEGFLSRPDVPPKLLRVLKNAVGTDLLEAQMAEDQDEAKGGSFGRSWRFVYPIWGMMVLDAILKGTHAR